MAATNTVFFCKECGYESAKWLGKCPGCNSWNSFVEEKIQKKAGSKVNKGFSSTFDNKSEVKKLNEAIKIGPRAIAIRHYQVQVRFDKEGLRLFKKNYINRPIPLKIENDIYFFEGTYRNLFIYFAQFGCHCEVLFPYDFMMALKKWYTNAAKKYEQIAKKIIIRLEEVLRNENI